MVKFFGLFFVLLLLSACGQPPRDYLKSSSTTQSKSSERSVTTDRQCEGTFYRVQRNDTLGEIALRCGVRMSELAAANELRSPFVIYSGQELVIPRNAAELAAANKLNASRLNWIWPVESPSEYRYLLDTQGIQGLEVYAQLGTLVQAVADGEVAFAEHSSGPLGTMIMIRHADNFLSIYAHNQLLRVKQGDAVKAGDVIAHLGQSGRAERPKLYFELRQDGRKISVEPFLGRP